MQTGSTDLLNAMTNYSISTAIKMPKIKRVILMIGAGGIVKEAHLPAYQKAGWEVSGIFDPDLEKSRQLATVFGIQNVYQSLDEMLAQVPENAVFDIAVPASQLKAILLKLPANAAVLVQKPFGENIKDARELLAICTEKKLIASVNLQMKFIPSVIAAKRLIDQGMIGDLHDMEIRMNIYHPWELWEFLFGIPRMEMLYHSIHYMDMIKYFLGMPEKVYAKTVQHPKQMQLASTRSIVIFDYDKPIRAFINTNHGHEYGLKHQDSFVKWEGTKGAIKATLGKNINFPEGVADHFEYFSSQPGQAAQWVTATIPGAWYPDAFIATMADLQCALEDPSAPHTTSVQEAFNTMKLVEAAYVSSDDGGTPVNEQ
jgi:predicted dehydrogenase